MSFVIRLWGLLVTITAIRRLCAALMHVVVAATRNGVLSSVALAACNGWVHAAPLAMPSLAQGAPQLEDVGNFRIGVFAGVFMPNRVSWTGSGTIGTLPVAASGEISLNTGSAIGGLLGYQFTKFFTVDLAVGYVSSSFKSLEGTVAVAGVNSSGAFALKGDVNTVAIFMNGMITPFGPGGLRPFGPNVLLTPYVGGGPGVAHSTVDFKSFGLGSMTLPVNATSWETDLAANLVVGSDIRIVPQLELGLAYQYVWINAKHLGSGSGIQASTGSVSGHVIVLLLEYRF